MKPLKEALFYEHEKPGTVRCSLCPNYCLINKNKKGLCGVRKNIDGILYSETYGIVTSAAVDPIEKKPLYHFHPGSPIYSIGTKGCTLKCPFCQNWQISQNPDLNGRYMSPEDVVSAAGSGGSFAIAFTYSEPFIWYEFILDTAKPARDAGIKSVLVTNGYVNREPLQNLLPYIDAMNIDLKCYTEEGYTEVIKGLLEPVKNTITTAHNAGCHIEVTTLIVPGLNDDLKQIDQIINFIASVDKKIPWHVSRYFPNYKYDRPPVDTSFFTTVLERAQKTLDYVYPGNISLSTHSSDTRCPSCGNILINRSGYRASIIAGIKSGKCSSCGTPADIVTE